LGATENEIGWFWRTHAAIASRLIAQVATQKNDVVINASRLFGCV